MAIGARPRLMRLYLLRAKVYRRLKLWEKALSDLELLYAAGIEELNKECNQLIFYILNDFGVVCIHQALLFNKLLYQMFL